MVKKSCSICEKIGETFTVEGFDEAGAGRCTYPRDFPEEASKLELVVDLSSPWVYKRIKKCPQCGTYYRASSEIDNEVNNTHHHFILTRLSDKEARAYKKNKTR